MIDRSLRVGLVGLFLLFATIFMASPALATGEVALIDSNGLEWFFNTGITFVTTSSASGAAYEAAFTQAVSASTTGGGIVMSTLDDAFDGYNALCISQTGQTGPCTTGSADYDIYNNNGVGAFDPDSSGRQYVLNPQVIGDLTVVRKFYVPDDEAFARWLNIITNNGAAPVTFTVVTSNNLGSDSDTIIFDTSNGDTTADLTDTWVGTMEDFSGATSSDPRLGHILQSEGAPVPLNNIFFANGDGNPYWSYELTLAPGETQIIMNFATGQSDRDRVRGKCQELLDGTLALQALRYMTATELSQVVNIIMGAPEMPHGEGGGGGMCFIDAAY
jgi:hypothetical protein